MGGILLLVRRSLSQHALSTAITILAIALAAGLVMSVFAINAQTRAAFTGGESGFDAVLGARGSQLQLVLNAVFHLETSPGNISWEKYRAIKKNKMVALAIPYAVGDNYRGFRIVGTSEEIFTDFEYRRGQKFRCRTGGFFDARRREAVIGNYVAAKTGLKVGDTFHPSHGLSPQLERAGGRAVEAAYDVHQSALSAAGGPDNADKLTGFDVHIHTVKRVDDRLAHVVFLTKLAGSNHGSGSPR